LPPRTGVPSSVTWWFAGSSPPVPDAVAPVVPLVVPVVSPVVAPVVAPVVLLVAALVVAASEPAGAVLPVVAATSGPDPVVVLLPLSSLPHACVVS